jgi:hypothetical protein
MLNFVSFGTDNCEDLLDFFYKNLLHTCKEKFTLHYYSINYKTKIIGENLITREIYSDKKYNKPVYFKPMVLLKSLIDIDSENFIYLDLDVKLTKNFSSKFLFKKIIDTNTPLSPIHFWEHPFEFNNTIIEYRGEKICALESIERCGIYVQNCLIVYSNNHLDFLLDWNSLVYNSKIRLLSSGDEELFNVILWKYKQKNNLGYICVTNGTVNINNLGRFNSIFTAYDYFQNDLFEKSMLTERNNYYNNYKNDNVMLFHGLKI